jgi:hypothetical protein
MQSIGNSLVTKNRVILIDWDYLKLINTIVIVRQREVIVNSFCQFKINKI